MPGPFRTAAQTARWLAWDPPLSELQARYPDVWQDATKELDRAAADGPEGLQRLVTERATRHQRAQDRLPTESARIHALVRDAMILRTIRAASIRAESGVPEGRVRLGLVDGWLLQRLFFHRDLERKAVSMLAYRLIWPLTRQRRRLMPLVRPRGIYCFYSRPLLRAIEQLASGRPVLEIAAGNGTLTRLLREQGVDARATDDYSWKHDIDYSEDVERLDAAEALHRYRPAVVVCSWPPPGNRFERVVFATPSVELYIVITSRGEHGASDRTAYRTQTGFTVERSTRLSNLVLPQGSSEVLIFRRLTQQTRHPVP